MESLPVEIIHKIFSFLPGEDVWSFLEVSRKCKHAANDDFLWRRICLNDDLDISGPSPEGDFDADLCSCARIWGAWRWGTVYNWEINDYRQSEWPSLVFTDFYISSFKDKIAVTDGSQVCVYTRNKSEIVTLHKAIFDNSIRDIELNNDFLIILLHRYIVVYRTMDFQPYLLLGFSGTRLKICKASSNACQGFDGSSVELVFLNGNSLWLSPYLFHKSAVIVDLPSATYRNIQFPWKCTLLRANENIIARSDTELAVYSLNGEKSFEITCLDYSWINTSKSVLALITDNDIDTYDRGTGTRIGLICKSFFEFHINYKHDLIYGLSKTLEKFKVAIEALSLLTGDLLWSVRFCGEYTSEVRPFLSRFLCYDFSHSPFWYILDSKTGNCLFKNVLPEDGRIIHVSDLFWVCQTSDKLLIRFY